MAPRRTSCGRKEPLLSQREVEEEAHLADADLPKKNLAAFLAPKKRRNCHFWPNSKLAEKLRDSIRRNSASPHNLRNPNL